MNTARQMTAATSSTRKPAHLRGFSLTELVMVIVMVGVLSVAILPNFSDNAAFRAKGYSDEVQSAARHAQKLAVASGCPVRLTIAANAFALWQQTACTSGGYSIAVMHPSRSGQYRAQAPSSVTLGGSSIDFLADGSSSGGSISAGGRTFTVVASTGYVQE